MFQSFSGGQAWGYSTGGESREELSSRGSGGIDVVAGGLGVTVTRRLRLGIAVNRWTGRPQHWVRSERMESSASQRYRSAWTTTTEERFSGTNVSLGALFKPIEKLRVGFVFKASFDLARKSENTYRNTESFNEGASVSRGGGYESDGRVTYPHGIGAGIAFAPSGSLTVSADWTRRNWSKAGYAGRRSMGDVYLGDEAWDAHPWPTWTSRSSAGRDGVARQADARQLRVGAEYVVKRPRFAGLEGLPLRVGVFSDRQPFKTLELQAVDYLGLTAGLGLMWRRISVDWTYVNVRGNYKCCERDSESFNSGASFVWLAVYRAAEDGSDRFRSQRFYLSSTVRF